MSLDYFQCQLFLKWRDKLHYQWPIFPAWLRTSEAFSIWTSVLSQLTFHRRRTSLSSVSCLAKKKKKNWNPKMRLQARLWPRKVQQDYHCLEAEAGDPLCLQEWQEEVTLGEAFCQLPTVMPTLWPNQLPALPDGLLPTPTFQSWCWLFPKIQSII